MDVFNSVKDVTGKINLVSVRVHKGDAMAFLAFDLDQSLTPNFVGFTIHVKAGSRDFYLNNQLSFHPDIIKKNKINSHDKLSSLYSPFQKYRWVHVPSTEHYIDNPYFGDYTYTVTPRYMVDGILAAVDAKLSVSVTIDLSPFKVGKIQLGFARAFVSSQAYAYHFANNNQMRPNDKHLIFDIKQKSGTANRYNAKLKKLAPVDYTFEEQHEYLGWQARDRVMEFLDEVLANNKLTLEVFAYDLNEPLVVQKLLKLAAEGRVRIILDDAGSHGKAGKYEDQFEKLFHKQAKDKTAITRGHFSALSHSKIFIQKLGKAATKVLTGSTNFSTNGIYINANHVIIFDHKKTAELYSDVFNASFGKTQMAAFKKSDLAKKDFDIKGIDVPDMTIRFSPHPKAVADVFFNKISKRIKDATSDVLFAIMMDDSKGAILDAVQSQVQDDKIFTYGITDTIGKNEGVFLYKPDSKKGLRVAGRGTETILPFPFDTVAKIDGYSIHHKFIVVDFKGRKPVVYCGSSNLAFGPEQKNGDNLLEIRNEDVVTAFAVEAIRLIDHFQWRNKKRTTKAQGFFLCLNDGGDPKSVWYKNYYNPKHLKSLERTLLIS